VKNSTVVQRVNKYFIFLPICIAVAISLFPYTLSGFFFDDMYNSLSSGYTKYFDQQIISAFIRDFRQWFSLGRFFPVAIITGSIIWQIADTVAMFRFIQLGLVVVNGILIFYLVRQISNNLKFTLLVILSVALVFQFNPRWDPISSFGALNQIVFLLTLFAWIFTYKFALGSRKINILFAFIFEFLALATYEIGIISTIGMMWIIFLKRKNLGKLYYSGMAGTFIVFTLYISILTYAILNKTSGYDGIQFQFLNPVNTFLAQFLSAFPLAFFGNKVMPSTFSWSFFTILFVAFGSIWIYFLNFDKTKSSSNLDGGGIVLFGLACIMSMIPPLLMALSFKYQQIVSYGDPYIVVYFQYWGVALLLGFLFSKIFFGNILRIYKLTAYLIIVITSAMTVANNYERINLKNREFKAPREQMELFVKSTFFNFNSSKNILLVDSSYPWESESKEICSAFFSIAAKKTVNCIPFSSLEDIKKYISIGTTQFVFIKRVGETIEYYDEYNQFISLENGNIKKVINEKERDFRYLIFGPTIGGGFYGWEPTGKKSWAWASGTSSLIFFNADKEEKGIKFTFTLESPVNRSIELILNSKTIYLIPLRGGTPLEVKVDLNLPPGQSELIFKTSEPPQRLSSTDDREFSFRLFNFSLF